MKSRLIVLCLCLLPTATFAQQGPSSGDCDQPRSCPEGQVMDQATKTCVAMSS